MPYAFEFLFHEFTKKHTAAKVFRGYRLLACDGSTLNIAPGSRDDSTYVENHSAGKLGYYAFHLIPISNKTYTSQAPLRCLQHKGASNSLEIGINALYDLLNRIYVDALIQPEKQMNEQRALADLTDRSDIEGNVIVICDRGYEAYNVFAHIEQKGWKYLVRVKDLGSSGILSGFSLSKKGEFDIEIQRFLTRRQTNEIKAHPEIYRFLPSNSTFDYLKKHTRKHNNETYPMSFRVVRFKVTDELYETVITNLDANDFSQQDLKNLYAMRWGIETSFRELKYAVCLANFHAKKREFIAQEIFARLLTHNFAEMVTSHVVISQADRKLTYTNLK